MASRYTSILNFVTLGPILFEIWFFSNDFLSSLNCGQVTDRKQCIRAHRAWAQVGSKKRSSGWQMTLSCVNLYHLEGSGPDFPFPRLLLEKHLLVLFLLPTLLSSFYLNSSSTLPGILETISIGFLVKNPFQNVVIPFCVTARSPKTVATQMHGNLSLGYYTCDVTRKSVPLKWSLWSITWCQLHSYASPTVFNQHHAI